VGWIAPVLDAVGTVGAAGGSRSDLGAFFPIPRYDDHQLEAALDLGGRRTLSARWIGASDHLHRSVGSADPAELRSDATDRGFERLILRYTSDPGDGGPTVAVLAFLGRDERRDETAFGPVPTELFVTSWVAGTRASYRRRAWADSGPLVEIGLDAQLTRSAIHRAGSLSLPPREGDVTVFGQPPGPDVNEDDWNAMVADVAPYAELELELGPLRLRPGVRLDAIAIDGSRLLPRSGAAPPIGSSRLEWAAEPRLAARLRAAPGFELEAAAGVYRQPPAPEDLSAVFGTPSLGSSGATHALAGLELRPIEGLRLELLAFDEELRDLATRSALLTPVLASALTQSGVGRSYGVQATAEAALVDPPLFDAARVRIGYTLGRSERTDIPGGPTRLADTDQTHLLSAVASATLGDFAFGARLRFATGFPRTPVAGAFYDSTLDRFEPLFGGHNTIRLPDFLAVDLRADRRGSIAGLEVSLYLELENLTNQANAEEIVYRPDFSDRAKGSFIKGLPRLAVLGVEAKL
jgi:hypothetical protein